MGISLAQQCTSKPDSDFSKKKNEQRNNDTNSRPVTVVNLSTIFPFPHTSRVGRSLENEHRNQKTSDFCALQIGQSAHNPVVVGRHSCVDSRPQWLTTAVPEGYHTGQVPVWLGGLEVITRQGAPCSRGQARGWYQRARRGTNVPKAYTRGHTWAAGRYGHLI